MSEQLRGVSGLEDSDTRRLISPEWEPPGYGTRHTFSPFSRIKIYACIKAGDFEKSKL